MDRYQKVQKPKPETPANQNEIRITSQGLVRNYISYATSLLQERSVNEIVLKAMGQAISKTVAIAEFIKRRVPQLHQETAISSVSITDTFEPIEEGLQTVEQTRHVSMISITLSLEGLNKNSPGYQAPSNVDQSKQQYNNYQPQQNQPSRQVRGVYNAGMGDTFGRGRGRGRGRGQGWNRGGYSNYQENGGYSGGGNGGYYSDRNGGYSGGRNGGYYSGGGYYGDQNGGYYGDRNGGYYGDRNDGYSGGNGGGYPNRGRGGGGRGGWNYRGDGYGRGRGGGGRGFGYGRGRMGGGRGAPRVAGDGGNQA